MRGGLDDALARIARWEELRRRTQGGTPAEAGLVELAEAIRRVVERYPDLTVAVRARQAGSVLEAQVFTSDGEVRVTPLAGAGGPPRAVGAAPEPVDGAAARLAEMLREDPSLLDPPDSQLRAY